MAKGTNIFVVEDYDLVIVGVPKCGQTSMKKAFLGNMENVHAPEHFTYLHSHEVGKYEEEGYLIASVVRNPYDRVYSFWKQKIREPNKFTESSSLFYTGMPFDETVRAVCGLADYQSNIHFRSQTSLISYPSRRAEKGIKVPEFIGCLEHFNLEWECLSEELGKKLPVLPHENKTINKEDPWTQELRELVYERYEQDFKNFGYEK